MTVTADRSKVKRKSQRIEARVTEDDARVIARAATLLNASVSSFVVDAALEKAETVVARRTARSCPRPSSRRWSPHWTTRRRCPSLSP